MDLHLAGRAYIVTGGSSGLGFATAEALVAEGADVLISSRSGEKVDAAVAELNTGPREDSHAAADRPDAGSVSRQSRGRAVGIALDNAAADAPAQLFAAAAEAFGTSPSQAADGAFEASRSQKADGPAHEAAVGPAHEAAVGPAGAEGSCPVDGVFVSVGGPAVGRFFDTSEEQWRAAVDSVLLGSLRIARYACERLGPGGAVGMVLSSSVWNPIPSIAISNALRPGIAMAIKNMADEIGPRGVRVFGVAPGQILTPRMGEAPEAAALTHVPLRRLGEPAEFGRVAAFLLSPAASYITGSVIPVDGGMVRSL